MQKKSTTTLNVRINIIYNFVDYTRNIWIKDKVFISDYDIIYLTGMNISNYILELSKTLCAQCGKTCNSSDILTMKCQCQFCKECLTSNLQASTNGEMLLNKFEKNYGEKYGCLCKNVFEPEEAFKLLRIDPEPYKINAQHRMNQYVRIFCILCGLQVVDSADEMMVNTNRTTDNYFRFKIKKPSGYKVRTGEESARSKQKSNRSGGSVNTNTGNDTNEVSYCDHIMCANCVERELQKDSAAQEEESKKSCKVFMCKICNVEHYIEKAEWNKIFKKTCCVTCSIF